LWFGLKVPANPLIDYCLSSVVTLTRGIVMSFFDTHEAHAVMLAYPVRVKVHPAASF
jgi:hypothetical protein